MLFGRGKRERERLEHSGARAPATVLKIAGHGLSIGDGAPGRPSTSREEVRKATLRVEPAGGTPYEVTQRIRFGLYGRTVPKAGDRIEVMYDPAEPEKLVVAPPTAEEEATRQAAALKDSNLGAVLGGADPNVANDFRAQQLQELQKLRDNGQLAEEHYQAAKAAIEGGAP